uniref:5'-nucleotidase n=1 Tax=Elaeophora elaphi TaxID=1147741 RepID=A0A0R3RW90_9BILA
MDILKNHLKVCIGNNGSFEHKIKYFMDGGPDSFVVIADFDYTLTASETRNGDRADITYDVFAKPVASKSPTCGYLFKALHERYSPIEANLSLSDEEKSLAMLEWWNKANDIIISAGFKENEILDLVKQSTMRLRSNGTLYFDELERLKIPLIIFSAGISNVIEASLLFELGRIPENVHIVSNTMYFNEMGVSCKFSEPIIHSFSKDGSLLEKCLETVQDLRLKNRIILLGDSLGDLCMLDGCSLSNGSDSTVLKIGFLNKNVDMLLDSYVKNFDMVIVSDQTMDILRHLNYVLFAVGKSLPCN